MFSLPSKPFLENKVQKGGGSAADLHVRVEMWSGFRALLDLQYL